MDSSQLEAALARWRAADLLDDAQVAAVRAHEAARARTDAAPAPASAPAWGGPAPTVPAADGRRTLFAEAVGYLGAALAVGALALLLGDLWRQLTPGGRIALAVLLTTVAGAVAVSLHRTTSPAIARLTSLLGLATTLGAAWTAGLVAEAVLLPDHRVGLAASVAALAVALPAQLVRPRPLPQLTLLASATATLLSLLTPGPLSADALWVALPVVALGVAWVLLGRGGWLHPAWLAEASGLALALVALQAASFGDHRLGVLLAAVVVAAAAVGVAVAAGGTHHLAVGAVGLFVLLPQLVTEVFGDAIGAPATLLVVGLLLVLLAAGLARARREVGPPSPGAPAPVEPGGAS